MKLLSTDLIAKKQHEAIRTTAGWYYFTHHLIEVEGADAAEVLNYIYTGKIVELKPGRARYTTMLKENGVIWDDLIVFRLEENKFWISTLHIPRNLQRLAENSVGKDISYRRITEEWDMYSVQGPRSKDLVNAIVSSPIDDLKFFQIADNSIGDLPIKVNRGGYTGEKLGYEIYVKSDQKEAVENALREKEALFDAMEIDEIDVMVYTVATEKGYVLITDIDQSTPFEVDMAKGINWEKDFIGKEALLAVKDQQPEHTLVGITVDNEDARVHGGPYGAPVFKDGRCIGKVTKFTYGFTVGKWVGFALIETGSAEIGDHVILNRHEDAVITKKPILD